MDQIDEVYNEMDRDEHAEAFKRHESLGDAVAKNFNSKKAIKFKSLGRPIATNV